MLRRHHQVGDWHYRDRFSDDAVCPMPVRLHTVLPVSSHEPAGFACKNVESLGEIPCAGVRSDEA